MVAIPVKTNQEEGIVAPLFGKAKYFALIDDKGQTTVYPNEAQGGMGVVDFLVAKGVKALLTAHLGEKPFHALSAKGVNVYFVGHERLLAREALERFALNELPKVSLQNYMRLLGEEGAHHHHGEEHHMGHHGSGHRC